MRFTPEDYAAAEQELSADDLAKLDNSPAVMRADAQFGNRPLHQRGMDQLHADLDLPPIDPSWLAISRAESAKRRTPPAKPEPLVRIGPSEEYERAIYGDDEGEPLGVFIGLGNALAIMVVAAAAVGFVWLIGGL